MQLIAPDLIGEMRGLSLPLLLAGLVLGLVLWLTGWWGHRFWIVLVATVVAGFAGLLSAAPNQFPPLVAGLLLAVAAGVLALALVRVVAFAAGGLASWLAIHSFGPPGWDEPLVCILAGGLVGLLLFRIWTMTFTSFGGALVGCYFGLCLADRLGKVDAVALTQERAMLLNATCGGTALVGLIIQFVIDRKIRLERRRMEREAYRYGRYAREDDRWSWWRRSRLGYRKAG